MYHDKFAYPVAKELLQSRHGRRTIDELLETCSQHYPSPLWEELQKCDYHGESKAFQHWWSKEVRKNFPRTDVEVLFIALEDVPYSCTLRGSTKWSRDPNDWEWWYDDNYNGPQFRSTIMAYALERAEIHDTDATIRVRKRIKPDAAGSAYEVIEMFYSLVLYGWLMRDLVRTLDVSKLLGKRPSRWVVIGHPDAVYGIILGRQTRSRWITYRG